MERTEEDRELAVRQQTNLQQSVMVILLLILLLGLVYVLFFLKIDPVSAPELDSTVDEDATLDPDVTDTSDER